MISNESAGALKGLSRSHGTRTIWPIGSRPANDSRRCADALEHFAEERHAPGSVGVSLLVQRDPHGEQPVRANAEVHVFQGQQRSDHEAGGDQQHQRKRDLGDDETAAQPALPHPAGDPAAGALQRVHQVGGAGVQGHARLEAAEQVNVAHTLDDRTAMQRDGEIDVRPAPHEGAGHHAYHRANPAVQAQLAADHLGIASELALPEAVTQHAGRGRVGSVVGRRQGAADQWRDAHDFEGEGGAMIPAQPLWLSAAGPDHVADGMAVVAPIPRLSDSTATAARPGLVTQLRRPKAQSRRNS